MVKVLDPLLPNLSDILSYQPISSKIHFLSFSSQKHHLKTIITLPAKFASKSILPEKLLILNLLSLQFHHSITKSLEGNILGATSVQMYNRLVTHPNPTLAQNPNQFGTYELIVWSVSSGLPQLVMSIPMYMLAMHM